MVSYVTLNCAECGCSFGKPLGEYNRQSSAGRTYFFCGLSCTASYKNKNLVRAKKPSNIEYKKLKCSVCGTLFTKAKSLVEWDTKRFVAKGNLAKDKRFFCSTDCGQLYSGKAYSDNLTSITSIAKGLRSREGPRYVKVTKLLSSLGAKFRVEFPIDRFVYDLAVKFEGRKLLVEFDENYHAQDSVAKNDKLKDRVAIKNGWEIHRIPAKNGEVFKAKPIKELLCAMP